MKSVLMRKWATIAAWTVLAALIAIACGALGQTLAFNRLMLLAIGRTRAADVKPAPEEPFTREFGRLLVTHQTLVDADASPIEIVAEPQPRLLRLTGRTGLDQDRVTHVHAQFAGRVVEVGPQLGQHVQGPRDGAPGTLLCVVESSDLAQAKSDYLKAKVQYELDADTLSRTQELVKTGVLSDKAQFDAENAVKRDSADRDAARQRLLMFGLNDTDLATIEHQQGRERMRYSIFAPRDGVVLEKSVAPGEVADPSANMFTISDPSALWVWGDVYERDWRSVRVGQTMRVFVSARPDEPYLCTIDWISPVLDAGTRSVRIRGRIDNADHRLLADMYARIEVTLDPGEGSIVVPSSAVVCNENGQQVMVVASRQGDRLQLETRAVRAEPIDSTHARILSGLSAGEWIVPRGALGLSEELAADR